MILYAKHPMIQPLVKKVNRAHRRNIEQEKDRLIQKLETICARFEQECNKLGEVNYDFEYDVLFDTYNMIFTRTVDGFAGKLQHYAVHKGFFYMWYKRERMGIERNEESGKPNTIRNNFLKLKTKIRSWKNSQ